MFDYYSFLFGFILGGILVGWSIVLMEKRSASRQSSTQSTPKEED